MRYVLTFMMAVLIQSAFLSAAEPVKITARWDGKVKDPSLQKVAPMNGVIADSGSWRKLWETWKTDKEVPSVDFGTEIIVVGVVSGPNGVLLRPVLDEGGDLRFVVGGTRMAGPGFGYALVKVSRDGVKTVNGKPLGKVTEATGTVVIPADLASFDKRTLEVKLWQYDPFLADVSADLFDELIVKDYSHKTGTASKIKIKLGKPNTVREDRAYYLTVFIMQNGKRTHMGEKDGKRGLCKVLNRGNPNSVEMIVREVGR